MLSFVSRNGLWVGGGGECGCRQNHSLKVLQPVSFIQVDSSDSSLINIHPEADMDSDLPLVSLYAHCTELIISSSTRLRSV